MAGMGLFLSFSLFIFVLVKTYPQDLEHSLVLSAINKYLLVNGAWQGKASGHQGTGACLFQGPAGQGWVGGADFGVGSFSLWH